ncbi:hypothetical protein AB0J21_18690 [Streptomyces sp. NPDC049954]|uniref:hypothetical protein n=1 Tax=Streptomyces sp. NPDC049954 TaxID=3155779 RepID=UPI00342B6FBC
MVQVTQPACPGAGRRVVVPERLAALTGRSVHALAGAMPELRDPPPNWEMFRHQPQTGCHLCDARHPGGRVVRLLPHHTYVCLRHHTWIGPPDIDHPGRPPNWPLITYTPGRVRGTLPGLAANRLARHERSAKWSAAAAATKAVISSSTGTSGPFFSASAKTGT